MKITPGYSGGCRSIIDIDRKDSEAILSLKSVVKIRTITMSTFSLVMKFNGRQKIYSKTKQEARKIISVDV